MLLRAFWFGTVLIRGVIAALLLLVVGCRTPDTDMAVADRAVVIPRYQGKLSSEEKRFISGMNYDPVDSPLAWLADGSLLVTHLEQFSSADVFASTCAGSGFYLVPETGGSARAIQIGAPACEAARAYGGSAATPDGSKVIYALMTPSNNSRLVQLDLASARVDTLVASCEIYLKSPAISADGLRVAAQGICRDRDEPWGIYTQNLDVTDFRQVVVDIAHSYEGPAWAPDGLHLAFTRADDSADSNVIVVADTAGQLRDLGVRGWSPAWSPDGEWIAYVTDDASGSERRLSIRVVRANGSGDRMVFRNHLQSTFSRGWGPIPEGRPTGPLVWSPDSRWLAFQRHFDEGASVWKVEVATGEVRQITAPDR